MDTLELPSNQLKVQRKRVAVTARDIQILELAAKWPFITAENIRTRFYGNQDTKNHFTRLKKLVAAGLLEHVMGDNGARLAFRIAKKGIRHVRSEELKSKALAARRGHYRTAFEHDKILHQIQDILESSPVVSGYMTENEVAQLMVARHGKQEQPNQGYKIPDGLFHLRTSQVSMTVAIELERSIKRGSAYSRIFREHLLSSDYEAVLYVVGNDEMKAHLKRLLESTKAKDLMVGSAERANGIYFVTLGELLSKELDAVFEAEGSSFTFRSLITAGPNET